ncbi:rab-GTPase-TBC domain-containing protein [Roridomyces roridus]|uniref:Rab-GTPase-TBC domain-containing protein n=1 Tax=Roridomyces roridus TaxID=1738132 RepID=A0AAD7FIZ3_9AGAR|nr:rab-GTPase-TBC domain-containing protein [Roridomyces roridus]
MDSEKATPPAYEDDDWASYRLMSLSPGGFGADRVEIWPKLLHATPATSPSQDKEDMDTETDSISHRDEKQIRLDTERSFVLYPVDSKTDKDALQAELHELLVEVFRRRPGLNYFQGYHDIITVLLLTLPAELQLSCAEQLSLQRVRDSMGTTLEPVLGLLRVMKNLLRVADPEYAELLEQTSPLPYYALPNLLTLFSHDMPKLPLIQHVFDYLLCRPPIFVVYLAAVIILSRKEDVHRLQEEGEEGMMHSLLSALPDIVDSELTGESLDHEVKHEEEEPMPLEKEDVEAEEVIPNVKQEDNPEPSGDTSPATIPVDEPVEELKLEGPKSEESSLQPPDEKSEPPLPSNAGKRKPQSLTDILNLSDALYKAHPPTDSGIQLSSIMGPQSVVFTWSPRLEDMPTNDEAERMVGRPELIVYPERPPVREDGEDEKEKTRKRRKRPFKKRKVDNRTVGMVVGAGLVLGAAIAISVYSTRQGGDFHHVKEWRKMGLGRWVGGLLDVIRYKT